MHSITILIILGGIIVLAILGYLFSPKTAITREELDEKREKEEFKSQVKDGEIILPGKWFLIYLGTGIPVIGFIIITILAFKKSVTNLTLKNWARLMFIYHIILIVLGIALFVLFYLSLNKLI